MQASSCREGVLTMRELMLRCWVTLPLFGFPKLKIAILSLMAHTSSLLLGVSTKPIGCTPMFKAHSVNPQSRIKMARTPFFQPTYLVNLLQLPFLQDSTLQELPKSHWLVLDSGLKTFSISRGSKPRMETGLGIIFILQLTEQHLLSKTCWMPVLS